MLGLKSRVILAFGVLSLAVALLVSISAFMFARNYLVTQRESAGVTRALLDARAVSAAIESGVEPGEALATVPAIGGAQALARVDGVWYTRGVGVSPPDLSPALISLAEEQGAARQSFEVSGQPFFAVAVADGGDLYLELLPMGDLDRALRTAGWFIAGISLVSLALGAVLGSWAASRLLRPVQSLSDGAVRLAEGDLAVRLEPTEDPDLAPITSAFNEMADAVERRIARERRFVANVSHELRSPVTAIAGTAELLDNHREALPPRDAELVASLVTRSRRLSRTLVDLMEIGSEDSHQPLQVEAVEISSIVLGLMADRGLGEELLHGDRPVVRTDARRVERVLANLLDNASTHGRGVVGVVIEREAEHVLVHVDDAGPGLPEEGADQLFEPFSRGSSRASDDGAGLGLAIAREAATALGGQVLADRSSRGGARMTLRIPAEVAP